MSHAPRADRLVIKPAAGARPAPPRTRGRFIPKARTKRPVTRRVTPGTATTRLAMAPDRPTPRVSQSLEASGKQNSLAAYARIAGRDSRHNWRRDRRCRGDCRSRLQRRRGQEQLFTPADAARIANVRPVMPGWTWPENPKKHVSSGSQTDAPSTDPLDVELRRHTADLVSLGDAANKWEDADKLANLYVQVFASAAEAHRLMAPFNAYSRGWGRRFGRITKDEEVDALGDEAWLVRAEGDGAEVTYHWRRANLVVEARSVLRALPRRR